MLHGTVWSLLPFLVVIPIAVYTRQVLAGLLVGLIVGAYMLNPTFFGGVDTLLEYLFKELALPDNLRVIAFLYGFGAFVGLIRVTGGIDGFGKWMIERIKTERAAFVVTWLSTLGTFMAPNFRAITVAPVMKQVFTRLKVPVDKAAFVIEATSTPFCAIMPFGTAFVGYMVGLISIAASRQGVQISPYNLFLLSIPLNFFALAMLILAFCYSFFWPGLFRRIGKGRTQGIKSGNRTAWLGVAAQGALIEASQELAAFAAVDPPPRRQEDKAAEETPDCLEVGARDVKPNSLNLVVPLLSLLVLTLFFTWWDGHFQAPSILSALAKANAAKAMLQALLWTLLITFALNIAQRQPLGRVVFGFLQGGNEMMGVVVLLVLVWALSAVSADLGFITYTEQGIGRLVPPSLIAPVFFIFGCILSYVIGSSFGTWGILLPIGFSLASNAHAALPLIAGAVFASGTFGGFVSPLSDNTVAMAAVMKLPVMDYAKLKLRYGLVAAGVSAVLYAVVGFVHF